MASSLNNSSLLQQSRPLRTSSLSNPIARQTTDRWESWQSRSSRLSKASSGSRLTLGRASLRYRGRATTTLGQIDLATGRVINGTARSSRTRATAEIANPRSAGGVRESNRFSLSISSSSSEVAGLKEGAFTMISAVPFNFQGGFLVQYWNLQYRGDRLSGRLTNTGAQFALAVNSVNVREPLAPSQLTMNRGTTITGRVTSTSIRVRIQGTGVSLFSQQYAFVIDAVLSR